MYYVCVESGKVISVVNYFPSVPRTVSITEITDNQHEQISAGTHKFDVSTLTVVTDPEYSESLKSREIANAQNREFLRSTDWQILRHIRQKALGQITSLTEDEYLALENRRAQTAARIV